MRKKVNGWTYYINTIDWCIESKSDDYPDWMIQCTANRRLLIFTTREAARDEMRNQKALYPDMRFRIVRSKIETYL